MRFGEDGIVEVVGIVIEADGRVSRDGPGAVGEVGVAADAGEALDGAHGKTQC